VLREPCVLLADFHNVALDHEGCTFPLQPYFTPKKLPEIYLGIPAISYGQQLQSPEARLAFSILDYFQSHFSKQARLLRIDTHNAFAASAGCREVVIVLQELPHDSVRYIRLNGKQYAESLDAYLALKITFDGLPRNDEAQVIDLRCPNIALVKG
jgi:hypothetical protein